MYCSSDWAALSPAGQLPGISAHSIHQQQHGVKRACLEMGIGIQAGYGMGLSNGQVKAFSYIGVGINWNFIRF